MTAANHFGTSDRVESLRDAVRRFVDEEAIPRERPEHAHDVAAIDAALAEPQPLARADGIYAPQLPSEYGVLDLS